MQRRKRYLFLLLPALVLLPLALLTGMQAARYLLQASERRRHQHRPEMRLSIPVDAVVWEEKGRELKIGDRLFDVHTQRLANGKLIVTGYFDDDETSVLRLLHKALEQGNRSRFYQLVFLLQCVAPLLLVQFVPALPRPPAIHQPAVGAAVAAGIFGAPFIPPRMPCLLPVFDI